MADNYKLLWLPIVVVLMLTGCIASMPTFDMTRANKRLVRILFFMGKGQGSGTIIKHNLVLTARHVCENKSGLLMAISDSQRRWAAAEEILMDRNNDICIIRVKAGTFRIPPLEFSWKDPPLGSNLYFIGYPTNIWASYKGELVRYTYVYFREDLGGFMGVVRSRVRPGLSGGGVYNQRNELAGVVTGMHYKHGFMIFTPISEVRKFLRTGVLKPGKKKK